MTVKLFIAQTLDGYIADKQDNLDWLMTVQGKGDNGISAFLSTIDIILMGSRTYQWLLDQKLETWPYEGKMTYVFSKKNWEDKGNIKFVHPSQLTDFVQGLQGEIWLIGGGQLIKTFLEADLIDEYRITTAPVLLGEGIPLFPQGDYAADLEFQGSTIYGQFVELAYKRKKNRE
ncbi:dihydrofolate reductase family protein [Lactococcus ileimucosae]|uniref:dihydrofolate reductase family protein n=1 Tax=Lactococcus ileimucosae TaxID=2941329 RepID=UPI002044C752|nr:dihydrofolate reductase family protein [Lactococcus ileimucosae]